MNDKKKRPTVNECMMEVESDFTGSDLLSLVSKEWEVYHIMVEEGSYFRSRGSSVVKKWTDLLGQRAIRLKDHKNMAEVIVSAIQLNEGTDKDAIIASWDPEIAKVVGAAIKEMTSDLPSGSFVRM